MKKMKRILSLFLAIVTILGLLPTTAFARVDKTNLDEALDGVASKTFYILRSDEEVALRIYKKGGGLITGRMLTSGVTGTVVAPKTEPTRGSASYCKNLHFLLDKCKMTKYPISGRQKKALPQYIGVNTHRPKEAHQ